MSEKPTKPLDESRRKFLQTAGLVPAALFLDGCASAGGQKSSTDSIAGNQNSMMDFCPPTEIREQLDGQSFID